MEIRAIDDIPIGQDLIPPFPPVAAVLYDGSLSSYCSACFSTLPPQRFPPFAPTFPQNSCHVPSNTSTPLYCSPRCSSLDSPIHFSSAEAHLLSIFHQSPPYTWNDSSDLRLSLRLASIFQKQYGRLIGGKKYCQDDYDTERIAGLMTNREMLVFGEENKIKQFGDNNENSGKFEDFAENTENNLQRIREGAKMMVMARKACIDEVATKVEKTEDFVLEEMILCLVQTNAVEVQNKNGDSIGIAIYGPKFSWINHSCSPNSCYRFLMGMEHNDQTPLNITPYAKSGYGDRLIKDLDSEYPFSDRNGYGPRVIVRSIKAINRGEEVTIAYTDLLRPKEVRRVELWSKYQFDCDCNRCSAVPTGYVDYALNALCPANPDSPEPSDDKMAKLMQSIDDAISYYLSSGDAKSCCEKLENLLSHGCLTESKLPQQLKLHPFHHLSINAYTTLASAYKVQASDMLALNDVVERHKLDALKCYKVSAAYSLLLAGVSNHLFMFESGIIATVANFWLNAGELIMNLAKSSLWDTVLKPGTHKCDICRLDQNMQLDEIKKRLYRCIGDSTLKVWNVVASENSFLRSIRNPIDFSWLASSETSEIRYSPSEAMEGDAEVRMKLVLLSVHCLSYAEILSSICYGLPVEMSSK